MKFPKNMKEFEDALLSAFRTGMTAGYGVSHEDDMHKDELDAAIKFCEDIGIQQYGRLVYPPQFIVPDGYVYKSLQDKL